MRRVFFVAMGLVAVLGLARPASADLIDFDINGVAPGGLTVDVTNFDWQPGNSMIIENADGSFTLLYQANLALVDGTPNILNDSLTGLDSITVVAEFSLTETSPGNFSIDAGGTFQMYAGLTEANDLTGGNAFDDELLILTGTATGAGTASLVTDPTGLVPGNSCTIAGPGGTLLCNLDSTPSDPAPNNDWPGFFTFFGSGGFSGIGVEVLTWDSTYFVNLDEFDDSPILTISSGSNNLPFTQVDPTALFFEGTLGVPNTCGPGQTPGVNCINGTGTHIMAESDASTVFLVTADVSEIPEPATLTLLGLGLAGAAVRRRQLRKRNQQ